MSFDGVESWGVRTYFRATPHLIVTLPWWIAAPFWLVCVSAAIVFWTCAVILYILVAMWGRVTLAWRAYHPPA